MLANIGDVLMQILNTVGRYFSLVPTLICSFIVFAVFCIYKAISAIQ